MAFLRTFGVDFFITAVVLICAIVFGSIELIPPLLILLILEISFSFDNAVVNAAILERMNPLWRRLFMSVGIIIAVFGVRFAIPIAIVTLTTGLSFTSTLDLAASNPTEYAMKLAGAHSMILMFAGIYLLMLFMDFVFTDREIKWITLIEKPLARIGKQDNLVYLLGALVLLITVFATGKTHEIGVVLAGAAGLILFLIVTSLDGLFGDADTHRKRPVRHGWGAFALFLYLEVQDASFSIDGVSAAFAITSNVVVIAVGLGIGALFVRSITVQLVKTRQLAKLRFLNHGAHWAVGVLAICMLIGVSGHTIPTYIVGLIGVTFIGAAVLHSRAMNRR